MTSPTLEEARIQIASATQLLRSNPKQALELAKMVLGIDTLSSHHDIEIEALLIVSRAYINMGRYQDVDAVANEAREIAIQSANPILEARALNELGISCYVRHDFAGAVQLYELAELILRTNPDSVTLKNIKLNKANALLRAHHFNQASIYYEEALELAVVQNDKLSQGKVIMGLMELNNLVSKNPVTGYELAKRAVQIYTELNDRIGLQKSNQNLGHYAARIGRYDEAIDAYQLSLELAKEFNEPSALYGSYHGLIHVLLEIGEVEAASAVLLSMNEISDDRVSPDRHLYSVLSICEVLEAEGNYDECANTLIEYRSAVNSGGVGTFTRDHLNLLARALFAGRRFPEAASAFRELYHSLRSSDDPYAEEAVRQLKAKFQALEASSAAEIHRIKEVELKDAVHKKNVLVRENQTFVSLLAHELKSPLQTIRAIAGLMQLEESLSKSEIDEYSRDLKAVSNKMFDLVTRVLDSVRGVTNQVQKTVNARTVWEYVIGQSKYKAELKMISVVHTFDSDEYPIQATEQSLITILDNVLSNAIKYSPSHSTIHLAISKIQRGDNNVVQAVISDQGPGIPFQVRENLFKPFSNVTSQNDLREDSTGLGLHLAKREAEMLQGRLEYQESSEPGALFIIELPLWSAATELPTVYTPDYSSTPHQY